MAGTVEQAGTERAIRKSIPRLFMKRMTMLSLAFSLIILYFYVIGNFQDFLDGTQLSLLGLLSWTSLFSFFFALLGIPVLATSKRTESKARRALGLLGYSLGALLAVALIAIAYFLRAIFLS